MSDVKEKRLIDANDALEKLNQANKTIGVIMGDIAVDGCNAVSIKAVMHFIERCKTVDAVEVVRCAECKYSFQTEDGMVRCSFHSERNDFDDRGSSHNVWMEPTDFCSYGERRTDE